MWSSFLDQQAHRSEVYFSRRTPVVPICTADPGRARPSAVAFRAYDTDGDGFVSEAELKAGMRRMVGAGMADDQLAAIAAHTLVEHDLDGDGHLSLAEFRHLVSPTIGEAPKAALAVH